MSNHSDSEGTVGYGFEAPMAKLVEWASQVPETISELCTLPGLEAFPGLEALQDNVCCGAYSDEAGNMSRAITSSRFFRGTVCCGKTLSEDRSQWGGSRRKSNVSIVSGASDAVMKAAQANDDETLLRFIRSEEYFIDYADGDGDTALLIMSKRGKASMIEQLIKFNANPNVSDRLGFTPLQAASYEMSPESVKVLLASGANVESKDTDGCTALFFIVAQATNGIDEEDEPSDVHMPKDLKEKQLEIIEALVNAKANPDAVCYEGLTPLTLAEGRRPDIVEVLEAAVQKNQPGRPAE